MTDTPQLNLYGENLFGEPVTDAAPNKLSETFTVPPFTVLNAREGWWQRRKRAWIALGIQSELGRGDASPGGSARPACDYSSRERGTGAGNPIAGTSAGRGATS